MGENVDIRLYSAAQIKDWLYHNTQYEGLSEQLIDKSRAFALVANPFVTDEMSLVSAIFVDEEVAAFTCVFPDELEKPEHRLVYWSTTLYVNPKYEGRGFAYCVIAQICELYGSDYFDLDAADASVENFKYQGLTTEYLTQYVLQNKNIQRSGIKGELAYWKDVWVRRKLSKAGELNKEISGADYLIKYVSFVDDELYSFMRRCAKRDLILRSQKSFNWLLQYPFMTDSPVFNRVPLTNFFSSNVREFKIYGVKVLKKGRLVGFCILRLIHDEWSVKYIYYDEDGQMETFMAIAEHIMSIRRRKLFTADKDLVDFLSKYGLFTQCVEYKKSFAYPSGFFYDKSLKIQVGEGDNVT